MRRVVYYISILLLLSVLICFFTELCTIDELKVKIKVKQISKSEETHLEKPLYIATIPFETNNSVEDDSLYLSYFNSENETNSTIFLSLIFDSKMQVSEKYISNYTGNVLGSSDGPNVFSKMIALSDKTSIEMPMYLLYEKGVLYGVIGQTAFCIAKDSDALPEMIEVKEFRNVENLIVYQIQSDGNFEIVN